MSIHPKRPKVTVSPGFLLLAGFLFYLDDGSGILFWAASAAIFHELGHVAAAMLMGGRVEALTLGAVGAELRFYYPAVLSYGRESLVALAGPAVNLLVGVPMLWAGAHLPAVITFGLGLFNLLPILPLDGGRVLFSLTAEHFGLGAAERVLAVSTGIVVGLLAGFGAIAAAEFANGIPLILAVWLLLSAVGKEKNIPK